MIKILLIQSSILYLISINIILLYSFTSNNNKIHPLILISILLIILIISSFNLSKYFNDHWFSFIIFLIIIGGLIIIFIYFIRFINNIKTSINFLYIKNLYLKISISLISILTLFNSSNLNLWIIKFNEINSIYNNIDLKNLNNLNYLFIPFKNLTTILSIIFLLICLTIIVKICLIKKLTLRKFNYEKINI